MISIHPLRGFFAILGIALATAVGACLLPENPYQRWQLVDGTIQGRARWIYERIHFDPRPIDVAIVGPSRIARGVDPFRLEAELARLGHPSRVVNFAMPEGGRNMNDVVVEEMLRTKTPKLIVIGVIEKPSRFGHPAYKYLASRSLIVDPGYPTNVKYLGDLAYLPFREMRLFVARLAPKVGGLDATFDPGRYEGDAGIPDTFALKHGGRRSTAIPATPEELAEGVADFERGATPPILPRDQADLEFGDERHYIRRIVAAARAKGVKVAFVSIPYYSGTDEIQEASFYREFGEVWNGGFLAPQAGLFADYGHLTTGGAAVLTDWMAPRVAEALTRPEPK